MNKIIILGLLLIAGKASTAQQTFTLEEAKSYALENHIKVKNAILDVQIAETKNC